MLSCRRKKGQGAGSRAGEGENTSSFYNAADTDYADMDEIKHHSKHFKVFVNSWVRRICR